MDGPSQAVDVLVLIRRRTKLEREIREKELQL